MPKSNSIPGLQAAEAEHRAALAARDQLETKYAAAVTEASTARAARAAVVARIAAGEDVNATESKKSSDAVNAAEERAAMFREALAQGDEVVRAAEGRISELKIAYGRRTLRAAIETEIELGKEADAIGAQMLNHMARRVANEAEINAGLAAANWGGRIPEILGNMRHRTAFVPAVFQNSIVQSGSIVAYNMTDREAGDWGEILRRLNSLIGDAG